MKLSILDQAPMSVGQTEKEALETSIALAKLGEKLGYERFWIAEHHDLSGLSCPNPEVMLGAIGARTSTIRIGAGAVLLPYYKPYRVAETYNLLATLYPNRIDLGIGRAPGGPAEVSLALADNYLKEVRHYPEKIDELLTFLYGRFPEANTFHTLTPTPVPEKAPDTWLLGTSEKSAKLAVEKGLNYAFGHFMSHVLGPDVVQQYRKQFEKQHNKIPYVIIAVHVICAETSKKAEKLALSYFIWKLNQEKMGKIKTVPSVTKAMAYSFTTEEQKKVLTMKGKMIIGDQKEVRKQLFDLQKLYKADELMIVTIVHKEEDKFHSYRLLSNAIHNK